MDWSDYLDTLVTKPESSQVKKKKRRKGKDIRGGLRNSAITNSGRLELGEQVYLFARSTLNRIKLESLTFEACFRLPRGFWEDFIVNECGWCNSKRQSMRCNRALRFYLKAKKSWDNNAISDVGREMLSWLSRSRRREK